MPGAGAASIRWKASWEIVFYQYEHERVYGLQVQRDGTLAPVAFVRLYVRPAGDEENPIIARSPRRAGLAAGGSSSRRRGYAMGSHG
jgi:hypothetical protein